MEALDITLNRKPVKPTLYSKVALGIGQILLWGGSYFILSVLAKPIMQETGWSYQMVYGALSLSLLISGLVLPSIGKVIQASERNYMLQYAGAVMAVGLTILSLSSHFWMFLMGWAIIGVAMGMGLYDALFASMGKAFGKDTGNAIEQVTLISSLAPSLSWFLTSLLLNNFGWRMTCFVYAGLLLITISPIHRMVFPSATDEHASLPKKYKTANVTTGAYQVKTYNLVLISFTLGAVLTTGIVIHLIDVLLHQDLTMTAALGVVAFLGPSQAGIRALDLILPKQPPVKMAVVSAAAMLAGIVLLFTSRTFVIPAVVLFGMGNGLRSILRGTLPLSIFGQKGYAEMIGKLGRWPLIAQALTPFVGGFLLQKFSLATFLLVFCAVALINLLLCLLICKVIADRH